MVIRCFGCGWRGDEEPRRSYHSFPTDEVLQKQWLDAIGKTGPVNRRTALCNIHFEESCFRYGLVRGHRILRVGSVPTLHTGRLPSMMVSISSSGDLEIDGRPGQAEEMEEVTVKVENQDSDSDQQSSPGDPSGDPSWSPPNKRQKVPEPIQTSSVKVDIKEEEASDSDHSEQSSDSLEGCWQDRVIETLNQVKQEIKKSKGDDFDSYGKLVASELRRLPSRTSAKLKLSILNLIREVAVMDDVGECHESPTSPSNEW